MSRHLKESAITNAKVLAAQAPPLPTVKIKVSTTTYTIFNTASHLGAFAKRLEKLPQTYFDAPKRKVR